MKLYSKLNVARREGLGGPYWREGPFRWGRGDACQVQLDPWDIVTGYSFTHHKCITTLDSGAWPMRAPVALSSTCPQTQSTLVKRLR
ncbi:predicted protein [Lichtheimia corymbifera JMRC:FSU:9682]|uniref:Uncharacterized protein n=1 Tax=Lichtheimia corymbifera JMRC:FSU:9682 TaxID=1263082 RepID=A0A068SEW1_9FUNG|nr:predicted protein [Lichtheimia corymbifera JMRC:FSU:9682]